MLPESSLQIDLNNLAKEATKTFGGVDSLVSLENARITYLGDKSCLQQAQKSLGTLSKEERPARGKEINQARQQIQEAFESARTRIEAAELNERLNAEKLDLTLPGIPPSEAGSLHPIRLVRDQVVRIFERIGFSEIDGPEIETEYYNFEALNTPPNHPARDEQDTFYTDIAPNIVLRSQTSPIQIRALERVGVPLRIMSHGRVYRNEEVNARKLPFFHQFEILYVDQGVHFGHLKWTLEFFLQQLFGDETRIRLRPDFFPFTEPSAEVDAQCPFCKGIGCATCGQRGWLELLGCGMVDPNVLEMAGIDSKIYTGFAAGIGLERLAMLKYDIPDIRLLYSGDLRFLRQFKVLST
ncbi:MAG: phenylalanine--tRNA ligase subunit alpha [Candidatus Caenarcaniphilales bacterium]|nr:phenylalanine--tRNA ligase subunit alpha [Candidatus Caenarcaniphilales bacterium]